jgi:hypothetical protein
MMHRQLSAACNVLAEQTSDDMHGHREFVEVQSRRHPAPTVQVTGSALKASTESLLSEGIYSLMIDGDIP